MDHINILRRSLRITLAYPLLWVFGILLALTTGGGGGGGGGGGNGGGGGGALPGSGAWLTANQGQAEVVWPALVIGLICVGLFFGVLVTIVRYVSETALIRLVDDYEETGVQRGLGYALRLGWSRGAGRIFLIDLLFGLLIFLGFMLLLALAAAPLLLLQFEQEATSVVGSVLSGVLFSLAILVFIVVLIVYSLVVQFMRRAAILEDHGTEAAIRRGLALVRQRLWDVIVMGLLLVAAGFLLALVMILLVFVLLGVGVLVGALPGLLAYGLTSLFASTEAAVVAGLVVGGLSALLVLILPLLYVSGLFKTYVSSTWTLTYRQALALEGPPAELPQTA